MSRLNAIKWHVCPQKDQYHINFHLRRIKISGFGRRRMTNVAKLLFLLFSTIVSAKPLLFSNMDLEEDSSTMNPEVLIKNSTLPIKTKVNLLLIEPELATSEEEKLLSSKAEEEEKEGAVSQELKFAEKVRVKRQNFPCSSRAQELARTIVELEIKLLESFASKKSFLLGKLASKKSYLLSKIASKKGQKLGWLLGGSGVIGEAIARKKSWIIDQIASKKGALLEELASQKGEYLTDFAGKGGDALRNFSGTELRRICNNQGGRKAYKQSSSRQSSNQGGRKASKGRRVTRMRSKFFK